MTEVTVSQDAKGLYILLSVETGKARLFANYAVDITDKWTRFPANAKSTAAPANESGRFAAPSAITA